MGRFENASRQYLNRTRKLADKKTYSSAEEQNLAERELLQRFTDLPWESDGVLDFTLGESDESGFKTHIAIQYDSVRDDQFNGYAHRFSDPDSFDDRPTLKGYRRITGLSIEHEGRHFDLRQTTGPEWSVHAYVGAPGERGEKSGAETFKNHKLILIHNDITSPEGLSNLFHEIGHVVRGSTMLEKNTIRNQTARDLAEGEGAPVSVAQKKEVIEDERFSEAFALGAMYRLLGPHAKMDLIKKSSYRSEKTYHENYQVGTPMQRAAAYLEEILTRRKNKTDSG